MNKKETIDGNTFEYDSSNKFYECRGDVCYDDAHDEVPEERLWSAACKLEEMLKNQGIDAQAEHSEKGWVEVYV